MIATRPVTASDALSFEVTHVDAEDRPGSCPDHAGEAVFAVHSKEAGTPRLLGLVTACDIARHPQRIFADLVSEQPAPVGLDTPLEVVAERLARSRAAAIAVLGPEGLIGAVTVVSLQRALLARESDLLARTLADADHLVSWSARLEGLHEAAKDLLRLLGQRLLEHDSLERAIEVLSRLIDARYGAIGLLDPAGKLTTFVVHGVTREQKAAIGRTPLGKGLLGVVVEEDQTVCLEHLRDDPRSAGFPPGHPQMESLLAVPISHAGQVFGRIYLCDKRSGAPFDHDDERLARCLADSLSAMLVSARALEQQRLLEEQLRQAQKLEAVGRLAGGIAHDFNNLLTVVTCGTDEVLARTDLPQVVRACLADVATSARRAATLTRQLLAFSRRQPTSLQAVDLNAVVAETARMLGRLLGDETTIELALEPGLPHVQADPTQVCQVLMNLTINARDAMPDGGTVEVATRALPEGRVVIDVRDTGTGISAEALPHLFEPFFTTKEPGRGTGLGLATTYGIMKQCGGEIHVDSALGRGTTFTLSFAAAREQPSEAPPPSSATGLVGRAVLLVVEDSDLVRTALGRALQRHGYEVLLAKDGAEALARFAADPRIRLVLSDVDMPGMSGPALRTEILRQAPGMRFLFVTGGGPTPLLEGTPLLAKPFAIPELVASVQALLDGQEGV